MAKVNISQFQAVLENLNSRAPILAEKDAIHQPEVDALTNAANTLDQGAVNIMQASDPGPRTDIDFSKLDAAVAIFKTNQKISQQDADNLSGLVERNTPQP